MLAVGKDGAVASVEAVELGRGFELESFGAPNADVSFADGGKAETATKEIAPQNFLVRATEEINKVMVE